MCLAAGQLTSAQQPEPVHDAGNAEHCGGGQLEPMEADFIPLSNAEAMPHAVNADQGPSALIQTVAAMRHGGDTAEGGPVGDQPEMSGQEEDTSPQGQHMHHLADRSAAARFLRCAALLDVLDDTGNDDCLSQRQSENDTQLTPEVRTILDIASMLRRDSKDRFLRALKSPNFKAEDIPWSNAQELDAHLAKQLVRQQLVSDEVKCAPCLRAVSQPCLSVDCGPFACTHHSLIDNCQGALLF